MKQMKTNTFQWIAISNQQLNFIIQLLLLKTLLKQLSGDDSNDTFLVALHYPYIDKYAVGGAIHCNHTLYSKYAICDHIHCQLFLCWLLQIL